ncbi:hypothetical protein ACP275_12G086300 [Erythranthe tilingii]
MWGPLPTFFRFSSSHLIFNYSFLYIFIKPDSSNAKLIINTSCSSSESGWTMYIASSPETQSSSSDYYDEGGAGKKGGGDDVDSDDSMTSDASSGRPSDCQYGLLGQVLNKNESWKLHESSEKKVQMKKLHDGEKKKKKKKMKLQHGNNNINNKRIDDDDDAPSSEDRKPPPPDIYSAGRRWNKR